MQMLYDSDAFVVVHNNANDGAPRAPARHGFEIVNKKTNLEVYLDGLWAASFQRQIAAWQANVPTEAEVEEVLASYCELAQIPLVMH
jgi:hypothetical protein